MLTRIHIDNYKCLTNFDLRLDNLTLLQLYRDDDSKGHAYPFGRHRSALTTEADERHYSRLHRFRDLLLSFQTLSLAPSQVESGSKDESDVLIDDGTNFAAWYRGQHPHQLRALRKTHVNAVLVVMIDGDTTSAEERIRHTLNETDCCPRLEPPGDSKKHVRALVEMRRTGQLRDPAPPSPAAACDEYGRVLP